ncbi:PorV/PorQ family protein [Bdellovibrio svalbardensis]|uniref:Transporter n=1 Tax=Bdellovibrio svalbardensis TaxID=2972972 RepID=A0ABT6DGT5_9BACT|nr:hypothetical protein [Bdellovibrio svalbardensis]MDG0815056.1 hypothetical protein [Bdellovibrio svalbardensis]
MLRPLSLLKLPVLFLVYLSVNTASAQVYKSSASTATGGTGRAAIEPGDVLLLNPATLPHLKGRFLVGSFAKDDLVASLSDNTEESALPAGFSFVQKKSDTSFGELKQQDLAVTLAEFIVNKWSVGLTIHYLEQKIPNASYTQTNADLGFMYTPKANIGLGLVVYNAFGEKDTVPKEFREKTSVVGGVNYIYRDSMRFRFDASSESFFGVGLETYLNKFLITRFGYSDDTDDKRQLLSAGFGFNGPRFQINYAYQGNTQKSGDYRHSVDLVIPF